MEARFLAEQGVEAHRHAAGKRIRPGPTGYALVYRSLHHSFHFPIKEKIMALLTIQPSGKTIDVIAGTPLLAAIPHGGKRSTTNATVKAGIAAVATSS